LLCFLSKLMHLSQLVLQLTNSAKPPPKMSLSPEEDDLYDTMEYDEDDTYDTMDD